MGIFSWQERSYTVCRSVHGPYESQKGYIKNFLRSVNCISLVGLKTFSGQECSYIYGLSSRTDRTDRKSYIRSVKNFLRSVNCISLVELRIFSWQERSYMVCRSVRTVRIAKVIYGDYFKLFLRRIHMMWTKFLLKLSRAFALFTRLIWRKRSFYELSWTGQNQMLFV